MTRDNIKILYMTIFVLGVFFLKTVFSRHSIISGENQFKRIVNNPKYNLAIVMFYKNSKSLRRDNPEEYRKNKELFDMFKRTSCVFRYDDADLIFLSVNLLDKRNEIFKDKYQLGNTSTKFILIKDGLPYKDKLGYPTTFTGSANAQVLQDFIDSKFETQIIENRERNREIREKKAEESLAASYSWGYAGWYPYGPGYWDCGFGPYGCGAIGFGAAWGGFGGRAYCGGGRGGCGGGYRGCGQAGGCCSRRR